MRVQFTSQTGCRCSAVIEEVTMLIGQDGTAVISLTNTFWGNELLLTPEETEKAIQDLEKGR